MSPGRFRTVIWLVVLAVVAGSGALGLRTHLRSEAISRYMAAATTAEHTDNLNGAATCYRRVLALDARFLPARTGLADIYLNQGEAEKALREHRRGVAADPRNADTHIALARGLIECSRYGEAEQCLRRGIEAAPRDAYLHLMLTYVYRRGGETDKAQRELAALSKLAPGAQAVKSAQRAMLRDAMRAKAGKSERPKGAAKSSRAARAHSGSRAPGDAPASLRRRAARAR